MGNITVIRPKKNPQKLIAITDSEVISAGVICALASACAKQCSKVGILLHRPHQAYLERPRAPLATCKETHQPQQPQHKFLEHSTVPQMFKMPTVPHTPISSSSQSRLDVPGMDRKSKRQLGIRIITSCTPKRPSLTRRTEPRVRVRVGFCQSLTTVMAFCRDCPKSRLNVYRKCKMLLQEL